jgi:hypothetical protein
MSIACPHCSKKVPVTEGFQFCPYCMVSFAYFKIDMARIIREHDSAASHALKFCWAAALAYVITFASTILIWGGRTIPRNYNIALLVWIFVLLCLMMSAAWEKKRYWRKNHPYSYRLLHG